MPSSWTREFLFLTDSRVLRGHSDLRTLPRLSKVNLREQIHLGVFLFSVIVLVIKKQELALKVLSLRAQSPSSSRAFRFSSPVGAPCVVSIPGGTDVKLRNCVSEPLRLDTEGGDHLHPSLCRSPQLTLVYIQVWSLSVFTDLYLFF